jgi:RNA polymerase sigma factor FliA
MLNKLWLRYKFENDNQARDELLTKCSPLVKCLARIYSIYMLPCCDIDDLISAGTIGLIDAIEKFDPEIQTNFMTYVGCRIKWAILDEIRINKWAPVGIQRKTLAFMNMNAHLEQKLLRQPTEEELAEGMGMSIAKFRKMMLQMRLSTVFLNSIIDIEDEELDCLEDNYEDNETPSPVEQVISDETKSIFADAIRELPQKESTVISLYYYEDMNMKNIGRVLSRTESRVSQIHSKAISMLHQALNMKMGFGEGKIYEQAS